MAEQQQEEDHSAEEEGLRKRRMLTTDWGEVTAGGGVNSPTPGIFSRVKEQGPFLEPSNTG